MYNYCFLECNKMEYIDSCLLTLLCLEGLLASKPALDSVLKTKHEKATCTHLTYHKNMTWSNTIHFIHVAYASGHMKSD